MRRSPRTAYRVLGASASLAADRESTAVLDHAPPRALTKGTSSAAG